MRPESVLTSVGHSQGDGDHISRLCPFNILFALPPEASDVQAPEYVGCAAFFLLAGGFELRRRWQTRRWMTVSSVYPPNLSAGNLWESNSRAAYFIDSLGCAGAGAVRRTIHEFRPSDILIAGWGALRVSFLQPGGRGDTASCRLQWLGS